MNTCKFWGSSLGYYLLTAFFSLFLCMSVPASAEDYALLKGQWQCVEEDVQSTLDFQSEDRLLFNGDPSGYQLMPGAIRLLGDFGPEDYFYQLDGNTLIIVSPDGSVMKCEKAPKNEQENQPSYEARTPASGGLSKLERPNVPATGDESDQASLLYKFAGKWSHYTPNTETHIYLKPDGSYFESYDSSYGGQFYDQGGYQTGTWGAAGTNKGQGRWSVQGTLKQGQISLTDFNGNRSAYQYQVHVKNGTTYWGEYLFNGQLYAVTYIYR